MDYGDMRQCLSCQWKFWQPRANPSPFCGTCARALGLEPRTSETDVIDDAVRSQQRQERERTAEYDAYRHGIMDPRD